MPTFQESRDSPRTQHAVLPLYEELSGSIIIGPDGRHKTLSPEEEAFRDQQLKLAVHEKMLGLPRTSTFDWHATAQDDKLPPYSSTCRKPNDRTTEPGSESPDAKLVPEKYCENPEKNTHQHRD